MKPLSALFLVPALSLLACGGSTEPPQTSPPLALTAAAPSAAATVDQRYAALPKPTAASQWLPPQATEFKLKNGLTVLRMTQGVAPLVSIHLYLPMGSAMDPKGKEGLTLLTADLLDEGAGQYSALELSDKFGELATDYHSAAATDYTLLSMDALTDNLEASLGLLADIVQRPKLSKKEFERRKKHRMASALTAQDDPGSSRSKALAHVLFADGYAGRPASGTLASLKKITWQDTKRHAKSLATPKGAYLVVAGIANDATLMPAIEAAFGSWKGKSALAAAPSVVEAQAKHRAYVIDFPGAAQSSLAIGMRAPADGDVNNVAERVMNGKIGGSFTGRINMNLREDKGYTYGARGYFRRYQRAGFYSITSNVKSEATGASIKEIFKELADVCGARPLTDQERNESVDGLLLGYPMQFDQVSSLGVRLVQLPIHARPLDYWSQWPAQIKQITTARANEAAKPYCSKEQYSVVIAGDEASVVPQLKALNLEVVLLDRDGLSKP